MLAILGAAIVYWVLMSNFLFSTVVFVHGESDINHDSRLGFSSDSVNGGHIGNGSADEGVYCPSNQTLGELYIYNHTLLPTRCRHKKKQKKTGAVAI